MNTQSRLCVAVASAGLLAAIAFAAPATAAPAAPYDWTGVYVGINGGYGFGPERWNFPTPDLGSNANLWLHGGAVGGTLGWNFVQTGPYVFGIEGDFDWANISGHTACPNVNYSCNTNISDLGTLRGRAGYAVMDRLLVFGTAGLAGGSIVPKVPGTQGGLGVTVTSKMEWGWTVGAGAEYAFADPWNGTWIAKIEYLYANLGYNYFTDSSAENLNIKPQINLIRAGVNYKF